MSIEERVQVVENDIRALHQYAQQTHAERQGWYNEFRDARAEARGWGEFAVKANNKANELAGNYKIIEKEVKEANGKLIEHDERFDRIDAKFAEHDERLDRIDAKFAEHDERFDRIDAKFTEHDERLDRIQDGLRQQSSMLRQLLEKVG